VVLLSLLTLACGSYTEDPQSRAGTFYPNGCAQLEGLGMGMSSQDVYRLNICQAKRIVSFGTLTPPISVKYGTNPQPFPAARLEFTDGDVVVSQAALSGLGRIEYYPYRWTLGAWRRNHPDLFVVLAVVLVVAIVAALGAAFVSRSHQREKRDLAAGKAAQERLRLAQAASDAAQAAAAAAASHAEALADGKPSIPNAGEARRTSRNDLT